MTVPEGYEKVDGVEAWSNGKETLVLFDPDSEVDDWHSCDEMGCGWQHVLVRLKVGAFADGTPALDWAAPHTPSIEPLTVERDALAERVRVLGAEREAAQMQIGILHNRIANQRRNLKLQGRSLQGHWRALCSTTAELRKWQTGKYRVLASEAVPIAEQGGTE